MHDFEIPTCISRFRDRRTTHHELHVSAWLVRRNEDLVACIKLDHELRTPTRFVGVEGAPAVAVVGPVPDAIVDPHRALAMQKPPALGGLFDT